MAKIPLSRHLFNLSLLTAFVYLLLTTHTLSYAQSNSFQNANTIDLNEISSGELLLKDSQGGRQSASLQSTKVEANINGLVARVIVKQAFKNNSQHWVEGEYVFPLPTDSAVGYMAMIIGERRIVGKVHEKQEAKKIYQQAKQAGKKTTLVEQHRPNLFRNRVANIAPGETIVVELHYIETLKYDQGRFSLRVPTTITPRYIPGQALAHLQTDSTSENFEPSGWSTPTTQVIDADIITPPMSPSSQAAPLEFTATINAGLPLEKVNSAHHAARVDENNQIYSVTLNSAKLDQDVVLEWTPITGQAPAAALFHETVFHEDMSPESIFSDNQPRQTSASSFASFKNQIENYLLLMVLPPQDLSHQNTLPKETIFIIDTSGSMAGNSIQQAQQALLKGISKLNSQDRFNIIEFDSRARALWPQAQYVDDNHLLQAEQFVQGLVADGGTEMTQALTLALAHDAPDGYVRQVIFITDGSVGNEEALFNLIENQRRNSRVFTVGIGSAPNSYFMQEAARSGQGTYTYIGALDDIQQQMADLFFKLENPVMTNIQVNFGTRNGANPIEVFPKNISDLYAGEPLMIAVAINGSVPTSVEISGKQNQTPFLMQIPLYNAKPAQDISKLWARKKIESLSESMRKLPSAKTKAIKEEIIQVAVQHQLLSKFTSFVAVEEKISRPATEPILNQKVPNAMPKGNTMMGQGTNYKPVAFGQTALGLNSFWLTGITALLALLLLYGANFYKKLFPLTVRHD